VPSEEKLQTEAVVEILGQRGFRVYPSTMQAVRRQLRKARQKNVLKSSDEQKIVAAALLAGGAEVAQERGRKSIGVGDVKHAWYARIMAWAELLFE